MKTIKELEDIICESNIEQEAFDAWDEYKEAGGCSYFRVMNDSVFTPINEQAWCMYWNI